MQVAAQASAAVTLSLTLTFAGVRPAGAEVVDRVIEVVGDRAITETDLGFEIELSARDVSPLPPFEDPGGDPMRRLEDARILRLLAGDVATFQPSAAEVDARLAALRATFPDEQGYEDFVQRWVDDEAGLREQIYGRMVAERYALRALGAVALLENPEAWTARYEAWMTPRRAAVPVRVVGLPDTPPPPKGLESL